MNTALLSLALAALVGISPAPESFGGWASISVEKVPDQVVTGKAFDLVFVVKQHGKTPLSGLKPTLEIKGGNHSQFGHYGHQLLDGKASTTREAQQSATRAALLEMLKNVAK